MGSARFPPSGGARMIDTRGRTARERVFFPHDLARGRISYPNVSALLDVR